MWLGTDYRLEERQCVYVHGRREECGGMESTFGSVDSDHGRSAGRSGKAVGGAGRWAGDGLVARAERLQSYNDFLNDPGFVTEDLRRYRAVDAAAIQRVAQEVLRKDGRVVVTVVPNPDAPIMGRVKE